MLLPSSLRSWAGRPGARNEQEEARCEPCSTLRWRSWRCSRSRGCGGGFDTVKIGLQRSDDRRLRVRGQGLREACGCWRISVNASGGILAGRCGCSSRTMRVIRPQSALVAQRLVTRARSRSSRLQLDATEPASETTARRVYCRSRPPRPRCDSRRRIPTLLPRLLRGRSAGAIRRGSS